MEETGCEIIYGAPTTLAVKKLMTMIMMRRKKGCTANNRQHFYSFSQGDTKKMRKKHRTLFTHSACDVPDTKDCTTKHQKHSLSIQLRCRVVDIKRGRNEPSSTLLQFSEVLDEIDDDINNNNAGSETSKLLITLSAVGIADTQISTDTVAIVL